MADVLKHSKPNGMTSHIDDELLERYSLGRLAEAESAVVEEHLLVCTECQDRLAEADEYSQVIRQALSELPPEKAKSSWLARLWPVPKMAWVPAAAAVAVVAMVVMVPDDRTAPQTVTLLARRGPEHAPVANAGERLTLQLERGTLVAGRPYRIEIANATGTVVWYGVVNWAAGAPSVNVPRPLGPGAYWVRLYAVEPGGNLLREYGLTVK